MVKIIVPYYSDYVSIVPLRSGAVCCCSVTKSSNSGIAEAPHNEIKYVLGIKESKFNGKIGQYSRAEGADVFL